MHHPAGIKSSFIVLGELILLSTTSFAKLSYITYQSSLGMNLAYDVFNVYYIEINNYNWKQIWTTAIGADS